MATIRRKKIKLSIQNNLKDYKGFGKLANGMTRKGFYKLFNRHIVSEKELQQATQG